MEIEIKARFTDKKAVQDSLIKLGAKVEKAKHQIDEYYNHPSRDTRKTKEYIRLRYKPGENTGVFAYHVNIADGVTNEREVAIDNVKIFKEILQGLNFPMLGVIDKKRETYRLGAFIVTIDEVKDIGNFVEIETDGEESEAVTKKGQCVDLLEKIGIPKKNICQNVWLCDIATGKASLQ